MVRTAAGMSGSILDQFNSHHQYCIQLLVCYLLRSHGHPFRPTMPPRHVTTMLTRPCYGRATLSFPDPSSSRYPVSVVSLAITVVAAADLTYYIRYTELITSCLLRSAASSKPKNLAIPQSFASSGSVRTAEPNSVQPYVLSLSLFMSVFVNRYG
jgi:hypothetical protein